MRMTPLDIQSHIFRSAWRGVDTEEVESFLHAVADDYEGLLREAESRSDRIRRLELRVEELSLNESLLKETLVSAQNLGDELRHTAKKQAEITVGEAEIKAEKILDASHRRSARLSEEIRELRGLRTRLASALRSTLDTHSALVDSLCEDPNAERVIQGELIEAPPNDRGRASNARPAPAPAPAAAAARAQTGPESGVWENRESKPGDT